MCLCFFFHKHDYNNAMFYTNISNVKTNQIKSKSILKLTFKKNLNILKSTLKIARFKRFFFLSHTKTKKKRKHHCDLFYSTAFILIRLVTVDAAQTH